MSLADKLHNARAIVLDHRRIGDRVWERFTAGRAGQLWYLRSLVGTFRLLDSPQYLVEELDSLVTELEAGGGGVQIS